MKKLLLFLVLLLSFYSKGQTSVYHPFPDSNAKWCDQWCYGGTNPWSSRTATYQLDEKVFINGNWYTEMLHYEPYCYASFGCIGCSTLLYLDTTTYYIRQDTTQKKVWVYSLSWSSDRMLYDFNLSVGDTIDTLKAYWTRFDTGGPRVVTSIDSILIGGDYRKKFNYSGFLPGSSVEGIGALHGLMLVPNGFENTSTLNVFRQNGQVLYCSCSDTTIPPFQTWCYDFPLDVHEINNNSFSISPNPAHDNFTISFNRQLKTEAQLNIYDMTGREVMEEKIHSPLSTVNCQLSGGVYFVEVSDGEKVAVQKLVVE